MRIAFIYGGSSGTPHPVHGEFARSIGAEFVDHRMGTRLPGLADVSLRTADLPEADVYLAENSAYLPVALRKRLKGNPGFKLVAWFSNLVHDLRVPYTHIYSYPYKLVLRSLLGQLDGAIAASEHMKSGLSEYVDVPIEVSEPFVDDARLEKLGNAEPYLGSERIVTVGSDQPRKGLGLPVEAFRSIARDHPNAELYLIGRGTEKWNSGHERIRGLGWIEDPLSYLERAALSVRPSFHEGYAQGEGYKRSCLCFFHALCTPFPKVPRKYIISLI